MAGMSSKPQAPLRLFSSLVSRVRVDRNVVVGDAWIHENDVVCETSEKDPCLHGQDAPDCIAVHSFGSDGVHEYLRQ